MDKIQQLRTWLEESGSAVFFGGAGVSTESGIPDFRSVDGLYHQQYEYPPEVILSRSFFDVNPEVFYRFYRDKLMVGDAEPNTTHIRLAQLEKEGKLRAVVTQNIDGLHQKAGSRTVLELHGSLLRNYCVRCGREYPLSAVTQAQGVPRCECGGIIRPDIVLYEEPLSQHVMSRAVSLIRAADVLIIGGTSLAVYPAAGLVDYYRGNRLVLINRTPTPYDSRADIVINQSLGEVFSRV